MANADLQAALQEAKQFAASAQHPRNKAVLNKLVASIESDLAASAHSTAPETTPQPVTTPAVIANEGETKETTTNSRKQPAPSPAPGAEYHEIQTFAWNQETYGSKNEGMITVYVTDQMEGVGKVKGNVTCDFTDNSFDLRVHGLNGRNYRLFKEHLEKPVDCEKCSFRVKKNKISIKLWKVKGQYGWDNWQKLCVGKDKKEKDKKMADNPTGSIQEMMKDMYDNGDDTMRKAIGEAMLKSRNKSLSDPMDDMGVNTGMPSFDQ